MAYILVEQNVEDYTKWKAAFDENSTIRERNGSEGGWVFRSSSDQNEVVVLMKWDNRENAKKFLESDELKNAMKQAGVVGKPNVNILDQMDTPQV
jgi:heme-degrading monooxygenase HmoA